MPDKPLGWVPPQKGSWHQIADERAEEIVRLTAEIASLAKDAARYRSIRTNGMPCKAGDDCCCLTDEELDSLIDDAIVNPEKYEA